LIHQELDRRLAAARTSDPTAKREQSLQRELTHVGKGIERLLTAYQEGLLSLEQLRERMPALRHRQQTFNAELQAIADRTNDRAAFLRLAETLTAFLARLRSAAETLSVMERQKIVRLLVKDVLVGEDTITIRHSIPIPSGSPQNGGTDDPNGQNYLLCKRRDFASLRSSALGWKELPLSVASRLEHCLDEAQHSAIRYPLGYQREKFFVIYGPEKVSEVRIYDPLRPALDFFPDLAQCILCLSTALADIRS
jgi:site-specific DNA recombinase